MFFAGPERSHPTNRRAGVGRRPEVPPPTTGTGIDRHRVRITADAGAAARIRDPIELVIGDTVLVEPPLRASTKNIVQLPVGYLSIRTCLPERSRLTSRSSTRPNSSFRLFAMQMMGNCGKLSLQLPF